ncbi:MAG TPA: C4-dicarboxylic acid transporter DauA [Polyangiales bacterium]|nr:C4-dicarboxylic acid transporter DauA [Polyangiales bacterium]
MAQTRYANPGASIPLRRLPAAALRAVLAEGYTRTDLTRDVAAGVVVGIVALPLSMALGIAVGVAPQHGIYTAIVAGFVVALLGGSRTQVTGPTAAFVVVLAPIYSKLGLAGLLISGLFGGVMLLAMGLARFGRLIAFIPHPVTTGFTAGIGTVIAGLQLKDLLGLELSKNPDHFFDRMAAMVEARHTASLTELSMGLATLALLLVMPRITKRIPAALIALPLVAIGAFVLGHVFPDLQVATIGSRFHSVIGGQVVHGIPQIPPMPVLPWAPEAPGLAFDGETLGALARGGFAIAILGAIESLLSAMVADGMARTRHDPDAELIALGVGNLITPFFGGIAATGAIARTATNVRSGARSPIAAIVHSITILIAVLVLAPLLSYLPMASLAALLLIVAWNMSEVKHFTHTLRVAPKSDVAVLLTCYGLTVSFDMVVGVSVGIVLAAFLFMRRMAEVTQGRFAEGMHPDLPGPIPRGVVVYDISGPLFFGAAQKAMATLNVITDQTKAVVLLMDEVHAMDATGLVALESALDQLARQRCLAVLSRVQPQPLRLLEKSQIDQRAGVVLSDALEEAIAIAGAHAAGRPSMPPPQEAIL